MAETALQLYGRMAKRKTLFKNVTWHLGYRVPEGMWETLQPAGRSFYGFMRPKFSHFLAVRLNTPFGAGQTLSIITNTPSPL